MLIWFVKPCSEPSWGHLGALWGHLGACWGRLGASLGPSWGLLGPFWGLTPIGPRLGKQVWGHLGAFSGPLGAILGPCWGHPGTILRPLGVILGPLGAIFPRRFHHGPRPGGMSEAFQIRQPLLQRKTGTLKKAKFLPSSCFGRISMYIPPSLQYLPTSARICQHTRPAAVLQMATLAFNSFPAGPRWPQDGLKMASSWP